MKKITPIIQLIFPFVLFSFLFLILDPMECSAKDQGFVISRNKKQQLTIESTPISIFSIKDKIIYPGSHGSSKFVIKNNDQEVLNYELILTTSSSKKITLPITYVLSSNGIDWPVSTSTETGQSLSIAQAIAAGKTEEFTLSWQWASNDAQDQKIQAMTLDKSLYENLHFKLIVEESDTPPTTDTSDDITEETSSNGSSDSTSDSNTGTTNTTTTTDTSSQSGSSSDSSRATLTTVPSNTDTSTSPKTKLLPLMGEIINDAFGPILLLLLVIASYLWVRKRQNS